MRSTASNRRARICGRKPPSPLHARKLDLKTGEVLNDDLSCTFAFPVEVEDGAVFYLDNRALDALGTVSPA